MAATYDVAEPTIKDVIRGVLDDRDDYDADTGVVGDPRLQDETIEARIVRFGENEAAAKCAETLASYWAKEVVRYQAGSEESVFASNRHNFYLQLAQSLRANGLSAASSILAYAGSPALPTPCTDARLALM